MRVRRVETLVRKIDRLFSRTLVGGLDDRGAWRAIAKLHRSGNRLILDRAVAWATSETALRRSRGVAVLGQMRRKSGTAAFGSEPVFQEQCFQAIAAMVERETELSALVAGLHALGHLWDDRCALIALPFARHPNAEVRFAVAVTLGHCGALPEAQDALMALMQDVDRDVRDWATFGLALKEEVGSEQVRQAFLTRLNDPYFDVRMEAAAGLAERKDRRVVGPLISILKRYGPVRSMIQSARTLLEMADDPPTWFAQEYIHALQLRFPEEAAVEEATGLRASRR